MSGQVSSSQRLRAYVQDYDSGRRSGNHGHECTFNANRIISHAQHTQYVLRLRRLKLTSFHGKFINVVRDGESSSDAVRSSISVSEVLLWVRDQLQIHRCERAPTGAVT